MADQAEGGLELRARLITVAFNDMPAILSGHRRITNLPASGYIRTFQVNLQAQVIELMVIDMSYPPVTNLGEMVTVRAECVPVEVAAPKPAPKKRK